MIADIPTLAIETVRVIENTSVLPDEFLAHRLGMIPLDSENLDKYIKYDRADCPLCTDYCDACSVELTLQATCRAEKALDVTSKLIIVSAPIDGQDRGSLGVPVGQ